MSKSELEGCKLNSALIRTVYLMLRQERFTEKDRPHAMRLVGSLVQRGFGYGGALDSEDRMRPG